MSSWAQWTARTVVLTAGLAAAGTGVSTAAFAQTAGHPHGPVMVSSGAGSIGGGNQVYAPITIPLNVCGNAIAVLGVAIASCKGGASVTSPGGGLRALTSGNGSVGGGNQVNDPVRAPADVCGNAVGNARAHCVGGVVVRNSRGRGKIKMVSGGNGSILGGNQVYAPVTAPVSICGNSIAVLGIASASCQGGATVDAPSHPLHETSPRHATAQCGCLKGSDASTPWLSAGSSPVTRLTSYARQTKLSDPASASAGAAAEPGVLGALPVVGGLSSLAGLARLPSLATIPGAGALA